MAVNTGSSLRVTTGALPPEHIGVTRRMEAPRCCRWVGHTFDSTQTTSHANRCFRSVDNHFDAEVMSPDKVERPKRADTKIIAVGEYFT